MQKNFGTDIEQWIIEGDRIQTPSLPPSAPQCVCWQVQTHLHSPQVAAILFGIWFMVDVVPFYWNLIDHDACL